MVKLSTFLLDGIYSQHREAISRKRKRNRKRKQKQKIRDDDLGANKQNSTDNIGIDKLSDDTLIKILSHVSLREAARTSVLGHRWKYLWTFAFRTLEFNDRDTATGTVMKREKFRSWVNAVLKFQQPRLIDSLIIRFSNIRRESTLISTSTCRAIDSWIYFAMQNDVLSFELDLSPYGWYDFPHIDKLLSHSDEVNSCFRLLRCLRLVHVDIEDEVVQYFLASCPQLEELCIDRSSVTKKLLVVDPPKLKILEVTDCRHIQCLEISAVNLVSLAYEGGKNSLLFKKIPNLCELTLGNGICDSFIFEPNEHSSYSVQLVKLGLILYRVNDGRAITPPALPQLCSLMRLELEVSSLVGRSLLFFTPLIKASPQLHEFRIKLSYIVFSNEVVINSNFTVLRALIPFPEVSEAEAVKFHHTNLKVVEMAGYIGCSSEEQFLLHLFKIAPSLERVVIDTESDYYAEPGLAVLVSYMRKRGSTWAELGPEIGASTRIESKEHAERLVSTFPPEIISVVI